MKTDNQHLEYLISQYMDGCLEGPSRKSLEQKLVNDPVARKLYKEQRDVQDVLDDWGSRIPLIHWDDFDKKLATRLEHEVVGGGRISIFRRWARPMSAAAALFVAATVGYAWHAWSVTPTAAQSPVALIPVAPASVPVVVDGMHQTAMASRSHFEVNENVDMPASSRNSVAIITPDDVQAARALNDALAYGMEGVPQSVRTAALPSIVPPPRGAVSAMNTKAPQKREADDKETPAFP